MTLCADRLRERVNYDPKTGAFTWRIAGPKCRVGDPVGGLDGDGYRVIGIDFRLYRAHRLAWLYVHGTLPAQPLDHINGDRLDNRIENLREANKSQNGQNRKGPPKNNTSGFLGVSWETQTGRWKAQIVVGGQNHNLGRFESATLAYAAYLNAKAQMHPFNTLEQHA